MLKCAKLGKELEGIAYKPFDNELGQRIYDSISQDAWKMWLEYSKMLVNEFRLDLMSPRGTEFLLQQAEEFFFGKGTEPPPDFKEPPK
jgi:Fe-S cluster biosynthesis and repair protein YggX